MSVYLSVCFSARIGDLLNDTFDFYKIFVDVAYGRGLIRLQQGDEIPRGGGNFAGFLSH